MSRRKIGLLSMFMLLSCHLSKSQPPLLFEFPKKLHEVSGIQMAKGNNSIYAIEDSGNGSFLHEIGLDGAKRRTITVNASNTDWEDLASDKAGNLYLGDFGNNNNERKDLAIYKIDAASLKDKSNQANISQKTTFHYPEQTSFPPAKEAMFFDCEAFVVMADYFYLFTKNRSKAFDGTSLVYKIKNAPGEQKAILLGKIKPCSNYNTCAITGAAISPDQKKIALLSHTKIFVLENFTGNTFAQTAMITYDLNHKSQKEAICFKDDATLLIADEKTKKIGGNVYEIPLASLKPKP